MLAIPENKHWKRLSVTICCPLDIATLLEPCLYPKSFFLHRDRNQIRICGAVKENLMIAYFDSKYDKTSFDSNISNNMKD